MRNEVERRNILPRDADMAQLVEHHLAKVAGSNPVVRSIVMNGLVRLMFGQPLR